MSASIQVFRSRAYKQQGGRCYYCCVRMWQTSPSELGIEHLCTSASDEVRSTAEHLVPKCDGGSDTATNIVAACARCNGGRHKRRRVLDPQAFRAFVRRRIARGRWHQRWVYDAGLLAHPSAHAPTSKREVAPGRQTLKLKSTVFTLVPTAEKVPAGNGSQIPPCLSTSGCRRSY